MSLARVESTLYLGRVNPGQGDVPMLSDETIDGLVFGMQLASSPALKARRKEYERKVEASRTKARAMSKAEIIDALCAQTPSYIRSLLETEDERLGADSLVERYARTFYDAQ